MFNPLITLILQLTFYLRLTLPLLMALAIVFFFWGLVKFIWHAEDEKTHEEGKSHMIWGMIILFVMVALWAIVGYIQTSLKLTSGVWGTVPGVNITLR